MIPIVTPAEMGAIDAAAPEPVEVLVERAGAAVERAALDLLGGTYGRRVAVVAGRGNNGADGRVAARRLSRRGVRVIVYPATEAPERITGVDLVIDAAYGTGLGRDYHAPATDAAVLAVDIPSGLDGLTGIERGRAVRADRTVTFAALKPGLVLGVGPELAGRIEVADIGLDVSGARAHRVTAADVAAWVPAHPVDAHKWQRAVLTVAGAPGMLGAARLCARAAFRGGAGYVVHQALGGPVDLGVTEVVEHQGRLRDLDTSRFAAAVVGPGLGRSSATVGAVRDLVAGLALPVVLDGDGLHALGDEPATVLADRPAPTVLTPHDGEYRGLTGEAPDADRFGAARRLAAATASVVVLKGPTTVVAEPGGRCLAADEGDARLATAGTGDVLAGLIGALLARGVPPIEGAAAAAWIHGRAARLGPAEGLVAGDLPDLVPLVLDGLREGSP